MGLDSLFYKTIYVYSLIAFLFMYNIYLIMFIKITNTNKFNIKLYICNYLLKFSY